MPGNRTRLVSGTNPGSSLHWPEACLLTTSIVLFVKLIGVLSRFGHPANVITVYHPETSTWQNYCQVPNSRRRCTDSLHSLLLSANPFMTLSLNSVFNLSRRKAKAASEKQDQPTADTNGEPPETKLSGGILESVENFPYLVLGSLRRLPSFYVCLCLSVCLHVCLYARHN